MFVLLCCFFHVCRFFFLNLARYAARYFGPIFWPLGGFKGSPLIKLKCFFFSHSEIVEPQSMKIIVLPGPNYEQVMMCLHTDFARTIQRAYRRHAADKYLTMVGTLPCVVIEKILFYVLLNYIARRRQLVTESLCVRAPAKGSR